MSDQPQGITDPRVANAIMVFLQRIQLSPKEIPDFQTCWVQLHAVANPKPAEADLADDKKGTGKDGA